MIWIKRILLTIVIGLTVVFVGAAIYLKTLDVDQLKGKIVRQISEQINRDVSVRSSKFKFSIGEGVTLQISGLTIMDDPDFSPTAFFYVDSARLNVEFLPLITNRQILVSNIEFDSPTIRLIRNSAGEFNFNTITRKESQKIGNQDIEVTDIKASQKASSSDDKGILKSDFLIRSIRLSDGSVTLSDAMITPAMTIELNKVELQVSNLSDSQAFPIQLSAALWSDRTNIEINSLIQFNIANKQLRIDDMRMKTDLSHINLDDLGKSIPSVNDSGLSGNLGGRLILDVTQMVMTEHGMESLSSEMRLTDGSVNVKQVPFPIANVNMVVEASESNLTIKDITIPIASGAIVATGQILEYLSEQKFVGDIKFNDIQLRELTANIDMPAKLKGQLEGNFKGNGSGLSRSALESSLAGEGIMKLKEGRVIDVNMLKLVLSKLSFIPNLVGQIEENLPERYKEKLQSNDTKLERVELDTRLSNNTLIINQAQIEADGFLVVANGKINFDQELTLDANLYIPEDLSASMIAAAQDLKFLLNDRKQIHIPFKQYQGKLDRFRMIPDVGDLGASVIRNKGKDELKKVIFRALDLEQEPVAQPTDGQTTEPQEREVRPEEAIIENILDIIPIFQ